ncbi:CHASE2 domain-containing protein [Sneathiella sp. P13V-1]|uniref:CHASE2 domain-containing protein n=1 Tax=Sneathiella sp. P13V-1 TaxID=2697366 RepID=UPI00187B5BF9|nr:CHASE2 domain-containing protein [Sneathiella sp. P13V-1]MBE7637076.1 CHASE2 domain-containing protein [Sneathiella sp. P13V-1]
MINSASKFTGTYTTEITRRIIAPLILAIVISLLNPLGIADAFNSRSIDFLLKITSPFYPSDSQNKIATVLIDESSLSNSHQVSDVDGGFSGFSYPPSLESYSQLIDAILAYKPKAIFVDIIISEDKNRFAQDGFFLEDTLLENTKSKFDRTGNYVPIFFPHPNAIIKHSNDDNECSKKLVNESGFFEKHSSQPRPSVIGIGDARSYNLVSKSACLDGKEADHDLLSPAFALYKTICDKDPEFCQTDVTPTVRTDIAPENFKTPILLRWGDTTTDYNKEFVNNDKFVCQQYEDHWFFQSGRMIKYLSNSLVSGSDIFKERKKSELCPYHDKLGAKNLIQRHIHHTTHFGFSTERYCQRIDDAFGDHSLEERLCNKVVLIGLDLTGLNDTTYSPVHGTTQGIQLHAMALDNLLTQGADYVRVSTPLFLNLDQGSLIEIIALTIFLVAEFFVVVRFENTIWSQEKLASIRTSSLSNKLKFQLTIFGTAFLVIYMTAFSLELVYFLIFKHQPNDWLGIASFAFAFLGISYYKLTYHMNKTDDPEVVVQQDTETQSEGY